MPEPSEPATSAIARAVYEHVTSGADSDEPLWDRCYAQNFESVEADGTTHRGRAEVLGKHQWWYGAHTVHEVNAHPAFCGSDRFGIIYEIDVEPKDGSWPRMRMQELGVYTVANGRVVREEFLASCR